MGRLSKLVPFSLVLLIGAGPALGVELGLAGIKLDQSALEVLKAYSNPHFIGAQEVLPAEQVGIPSMAMAPGGMAGGGMPGMPGVPPGGMMMAPGMPSGAPPGAGMPGVPTAPPDPNTYWVYERSPQAKLIFGIEEGGTVSSIMVLGESAPNVLTSKGVGLGDSFATIVSKYTYPDQTKSIAGNLVALYPDQGVTFTLSRMRVSAITVGSNYSLSLIPLLPSVTPSPGGPPGLRPPGL